MNLVSFLFAGSSSLSLFRQAVVASIEGGKATQALLAARSRDLELTSAHRTALDTCNGLRAELADERMLIKMQGFAMGGDGLTHISAPFTTAADANPSVVEKDPFGILMVSELS